jgi:hypothetical protein
VSKTSHKEPRSPVVLIVEDEFLLRSDLADCLRDAGLINQQTLLEHAVNSWPLNDHHNKFRDFVHKFDFRCCVRQSRNQVS